MPGTALSTFQILTHLILITALREEEFFPHFTEGETEERARGLELVRDQDPKP